MKMFAMNERCGCAEEPLFLESVLFNHGRFPLLERHMERMRVTSMAVFGKQLLFDASVLSASVPAVRGCYKCRILYGREVHGISFHPYTPRRIRNLRWVEASPIDYRFKYADRKVLELLREKRGACDDILIGQDGFVSDTSYSNVVLWDGTDFYTPEHCLLNGIRRRFLLETGKIKARCIRKEDLASFQKLFLINAMMDLSDGIGIDTFAIAD